MYLEYGTQPNIFFVIGLLSWYNFDLKIRYLCITKQVFCYPKKKSRNYMGIRSNKTLRKVQLNRDCELC